MPRAHPGANNPRGLTDIPLKIEAADAKDKARAKRIADALAKAYPDAHCELDYTTPHELLIATILSAQATDVGVNKATPGLFKAFPTPADYAKATPEKIEPLIKTIGLFRGKAKSVHASMTTVCENFDSEIPQTMQELLTLRGVARKTANVVLGNAFGINAGFVVDTHIQRFAYRFGFVEEPKTPTDRVERRLMALFPRARWSELGHQMIFHGRRACPARSGTPHEHAICKKFGVHCP